MVGNFRDVFAKRAVKLTVVGKVFRPSKNKILALNKCLEEYFGLVNWCLSFNSMSKTFLHKNGYERAKKLFKHSSNSDSKR